MPCTRHWHSFALLLCGLAFTVRRCSASVSFDEALAARPEQFSILRAAVKSHYLSRTLPLFRGGVTIFAPTDAAFASYFKSWGISQQQFLDEPGQKVDCLLCYSMVGGGARTDSLLRSALSQYSRKTPTGHQIIGMRSLCESACTSNSCWRSLILHTDAHGYGGMQAGGALIKTTDTSWENGIIHVVDAVPAPVFWCPSSGRSLGSALASRPDLSIFNAALAATRILGILDQRSWQDRKYTVFAPNDAAMQALLNFWGVSKDAFLKGDAFRSAKGLISYLILCGYGDLSDLWRVSASNGGDIQAQTFCPCDGKLRLQAFGVLGRSESLLVSGIRIKDANTLMWRGGPIHVLDLAPQPPCWSIPAPGSPAPGQVALQSSMPGPEATVMSSTTIWPGRSTTLAVPAPKLQFALEPGMGDFCDPDLDAVLAETLGSKAGLLRDALRANGLGERLETRIGRVTVFAPTDKAIKKFMADWSLTEIDLLAPSWQGHDCVQLLFKNLVHASELKAAALKKWTVMNGGTFELPTLCGKECPTGIRFTSSGGALLAEGSPLLLADIPWCKGVVHVIDAMPVPPDWTSGTPSCKKVQGAVPNIGVASLLAQSPSPAPYSSPKDESQSSLPLIAAIVAILLSIVCLCCVSVWYLNYLSRTCKVSPSHADLQAITEANVLGLDTFEPCKPHKGKLDIEKGRDVQNAIRVSSVGSEASTRCPSEASWDTCSIASSVPMTGRSRTSSKSSHWETSSQVTIGSWPAGPPMICDAPQTMYPQPVIASIQDTQSFQNNTRPDAQTERWQAIWSKSHGKFYYWNARAGQTSWVPPVKDSEQSSLRSSGQNTPKVSRSPSKGSSSSIQSWSSPSSRRSSASSHSLRQVAEATHGRVARQNSLVIVRETA